MSVAYDEAARLFDRGEFLQLITASGRGQIDLRTLEPRHRVILGNALALAGRLEEAKRLAELDRNPILSAEIRSRAEATLSIVYWRIGEVASALKHARSAVQLAYESNVPERIAWAHLHLFRILIESGPTDAIAVALADARRFAASVGLPQVTAYLHNCVAVLEGQTGRLDEARRHLNISESLLRLEPNAWLAGSMEMHRGSIACAKCEFGLAAEHFRIAKEDGKRCGSLHATVADTSLGYVQLLVGQFERAQDLLAGVMNNPDAAVLLKLAATDSIARVHLALGEFNSCDRSLQLIEAQVQQHPEVASVYHVRWAAIARARLLMKQDNLDEALERALAAREQAWQSGDNLLDATASLVAAQVAARRGLFATSSAFLLSADRLGVTTIRDLQPQYYYASALVLRDLRTPLADLLRDRALRLWADQGVVSVRLEMDDGPSTAPPPHTETTQAPPARDASAACVADSLAAFADLAHRPRLLGVEMLAAVEALDCSPGARVVESRVNGDTPEPSETTTVLPLGLHGQKKLTLVCAIPDDPVKAILLADVLRLGRAALALERAREEERNRAALWPAPPIEEQAGALFLAEEMKTLLATARRIAPTTVPVLITGETGTGKEVLARTIHAYSNRSTATFLPFNCSGVPKDMLDSQLFGHRKGSFTGALEHFPGVIRAATGGTLFLDEIGDTTLEVQPKLLRFLESNEVHPIGEVQPVRSDVRIIAATNADLDALVAQGRFREDLFYRLNIVRLHVPPLRERRVEVPSLAHHYLQKHAQEYRKGHLRLAEETMEFLVLYRWPGNVRQLANEMRRMAALAETDAVLMPEHLSGDIAASRRTIPASERALDPTEVVVRIDQPMPAAVQHLERAMIQHAMRATGGRMEETAELLGVSRKGLYLKRVRYGLEPPETAADVEVA